MEKATTAITKINISRNTFAGATAEPTIINFFFGRNGSGKSTLAESLHDGSCASGRPTDSLSNYTSLIFNQDFIDTNFKTYDDLPGVFTYKKKNIEVEDSIREMKKTISDTESKLSVSRVNAETKMAYRTNLTSDIAKLCWGMTDEIKKRYPDALRGKKGSAAVLFENIENVINPQEQDLTALDELYKASYETASIPMDELSLPGQDASEYDCKKIPGYDLLGKSVVSTSNTPYAQYIKNLNASDWVRNGAHFLEHSNGCCPFCKTTLPDNFNDHLQSLFDQKYQEDIELLNSFYQRYSEMVRRFKAKTLVNASIELAGGGKERITSRTQEISDALDKNLLSLDTKIKEPSLQIEIRDVTADVDILIQEIREINEKVRDLRAIASEKQKNRTKCTDLVLAHIASMTAEAREEYHINYEKTSKECDIFHKECADFEKTISDLNRQIQSLSGQTEGITEAMNHINLLLRHSGFEGFYLDRMPGQDDAKDTDKYCVRRKDGTIAEKLSEGERNFIAFLYFYYSVQGGKKSGSENKEKIVIIDDPVSSMDSNALFIVGSLVRQMIQACESRWTYDVPEITPFNIAQMFILTHNVPFHRDITQNMEKYEHRKTVKFFLVRKVNNESSIKTCTRPSETSGIEEDYNPVKNSYTVLWNEYQELNSAASVMHVIHQILESYFIQLCGYDIETFSDMVLKKILEKHTPKRDDGSDDLTLYTIAQSLLSCFNIIPSVIDEGLSLIDDLESLDHFRDAFKLIFTAMEQDQHYEMMMHAAKELSDNPTIS